MIDVWINKLVPRHWTEYDRTYNDDSLEAMSQWCEKNCFGKWTYNNFHDIFIWDFELEEEAVAFKLRWG